MRMHEIWDDWVVYDEDGFRCDIREDAPDDVKKAYAEFLVAQEAQKPNGRILK